MNTQPKKQVKETPVQPLRMSDMRELFTARNRYIAAKRAYEKQLKFCMARLLV